MTSKTEIHSTIEKIQKRDGSLVPFDISHITHAISRGMMATGEGGEDDA
ncbi:MAG: hypothetical protein KA052_03455, partial [Candidatus Pacebacteria bacterium]|nr:hypothetical protein [Candidatus Paceibacterota bacterium]